MNNIVSNFDQIIGQASPQTSYAGGQAKQTGAPAEKRRGILREYLQVKFLAGLYSQSAARKLSFIGGTCLRILHGIGRFSEDLDFDNLGLSRQDLSRMIVDVGEEFSRENIDVEVSAKLKEGITYHSLRFPNLLFDLKITTNPREKLMIKIDYSTQWKGQEMETALMAKYGFTEQIVTNPLSQIMVQKLAAYVTRARTQPRDMYDIVWLYSRGARPDREFMRANRMTDVVERAKEKFSREGAAEATVRRLRPFLFNETEIRKVRLLEDVLKKL